MALGEFSGSVRVLFFRRGAFAGGVGGGLRSWITEENSIFNNTAHTPSFRLPRCFRFLFLFMSGLCFGLSVAGLTERVCLAREGRPDMSTTRVREISYEGGRFEARREAREGGRAPVVYLNQ